MTPSARYALAEEIAKLFWPAFDAAEKASFQRKAIWEKDFSMAVDALFSGFGRHSSDGARPSGIDEAGFASYLHTMSQHLDFVSFHAWDPLSGRRSRILTYFSGTTSLCADGTTVRDLQRRYKDLEQLYIALSNEPGSSTFVQSVADNAQRPVAVILSPQSSECSIFGSYVDYAVLPFPRESLLKMWRGARRGAQSQHELLECFRRPPEDFSRLCSDNNIAHILEPYVGRLSVDQLWTMLGGLAFWDDGIGLTPYALVLFTIPSGALETTNRNPFYVAVSGSWPGTPTLRLKELKPALDALGKFADVTSLALCGVASRLNAAWEYERKKGRFFLHEAPKLARDHTEWMGELFKHLPSSQHTIPYGLRHYAQNTLGMFQHHALMSREWNNNFRDYKMSGSAALMDVLFDVAYENTAPSATAKDRRIELCLEPGTLPCLTFADLVTIVTPTPELLALPRLRVKHEVARTLLSNLVRNAVRHSDGLITVAVCRNTEDAVSLQVTDLGTTPFFERDIEKGTGLEFAKMATKKIRQELHDDTCDLILPLSDDVPKTFQLRFPICPGDDSCQ